VEFLEGPPELGRVGGEPIVLVEVSAAQEGVCLFLSNEFSDLPQGLAQGLASPPP